MAIAPPSQDSHFVRLDRILFASSRAEAAVVLEQWKNMPNKISY